MKAVERIQGCSIAFDSREDTLLSISENFDPQALLKEVRLPLQVPHKFAKFFPDHSQIQLV